MTDKRFDEPSEELKNKISDYILKSGFPLESQVRELLIKANSTLAKETKSEVQYHATYLDPEDNKLRETDVNWFIPSWHKGSPSLFYNYFFECKTSEKYSWVFFTEPSPETSHWQLFAANLANLQILPDLYVNPTDAIGTPILYGRTNRLAYSYLTYPESSPDNIRSAIFQAIKPGFVDSQQYLDDLLSDGQEFIKSASLFFPVVVYSGYLFEYTYDSESNANILIPANHVVVSFAHTFNGHRLNFFVDVVRSDYLSNYLNQQIQDIIQIHNYVEKAKPNKLDIKIRKILK